MVLVFDMVQEIRERGLQRVEKLKKKIEPLLKKKTPEAKKKFVVVLSSEWSMRRFADCCFVSGRFLFFS